MLENTLHWKIKNEKVDRERESERERGREKDRERGREGGEKEREGERERGRERGREREREKTRVSWHLYNSNRHGCTNSRRRRSLPPHYFNNITASSSSPFREKESTSKVQTSLLLLLAIRQEHAGKPNPTWHNSDPRASTATSTAWKAARTFQWLTLHVDFNFLLLLLAGIFFAAGKKRKLNTKGEREETFDADRWDEVREIINGASCGCSQEKKKCRDAQRRQPSSSVGDETRVERESSFSRRKLSRTLRRVLVATGDGKGSSRRHSPCRV